MQMTYKDIQGNFYFYNDFNIMISHLDLQSESWMTQFDMNWCQMESVAFPLDWPWWMVNQPHDGESHEQVWKIIIIFYISLFCFCHLYLR